MTSASKKCWLNTSTTTTTTATAAVQNSEWNNHPPPIQHWKNSPGEGPHQEKNPCFRPPLHLGCRPTCTRHTFALNVSRHLHFRQPHLKCPPRQILLHEALCGLLTARAASVSGEILKEASPMSAS